MVLFLASAAPTLGETVYVSPSGTHQAPYTNWVNAATNIQAAIDVALAGDTVLVANGVYATGGTVVHGSMTNRIAITKAITVTSVSGPDSTFIVGNGPLGDSAVRCAYVGTNAVLSGFTLTNGHTRTSGDSYTERSGGGALCEASAVVSNCILSGNGAMYGGGTYEGTVQNCAISGNEAYYGGGTYEATAQVCTISGNTAQRGGGTYYGTVQNCSILGNSASYGGGGTYYGTVQNCAISGNEAYYGGGTYGATAQDCTITANSAGSRGGGTYQGTVQNCIVYYNSGVREVDNCLSMAEYTCTIPDRGGTGNITNAPSLVAPGNPHLLPDSPCIDAGSNEAWMATAFDIDGEPRIGNGTVDMGCDEIHVGSLTGALAVAILADYTNVAVGFPIGFEADIQGRPEGYAWDWGDGEVGSNVFWASHAYAGPGDYDVVLQAWNLDTTAAATLTVHVVSGATNYVSPSGSHSAPYLTWATAATNIQAAIAAQTIPGGTVLVTNGVYDTGGVVAYGAMTNRIAITNEIVVRSVNGPEYTYIVGSGPLGDTAVRCAYVGTNAALSGFTLTNGHTRTSGDSYTERCGGGAWCEASAVVSNCTITENSASYYGGGTYQGTVQDCTISGNSASSGGGGTYRGTVWNCAIIDNSTSSSGGGTLYSTVLNCAISGNSANNGGGTCQGTVQNCTISENSASGYSGGGTYNSAVQNCIVYYNVPDNCSGGTAEHTCTTPNPGGTGNITNAPGLVAVGNPHILPDSPCIDAGTNETWWTTAFDIDGEPRIGNGTVDMGCDEVHTGSLTGVLAVALSANHTNVAVGYPIAFEGDVLGRPEGYAWHWGDGEVKSNVFWTSHAYAGPGDYDVVLQAWNLDTTASATLTVHVVSATNYVSHSGSHTAPYLSWTTAATNIQAAIAAQTIPGGTVLVANGVYDTGGVVVHGSMTNRIAITNEVVVRSVNGPEHTFIVGSGPLGDAAVRCAYVGTNAALSGFTLTNGHTRASGSSTTERSGGGAWCEPSAVVSNCTISGNVASSYGGGTCYGAIQNSTVSGNEAYFGGGTGIGTVQNCAISGNEAHYGGGTYEAAVQDCTISGNTAQRGGGTYYGTVQNCIIAVNQAIFGGGTYGGTAQNCTISGNEASDSVGGAYGSTVQNCIVYYNSAVSGADNCTGAAEYTCTFPDLGGTGNITNAPGLVAFGNPHILPDSPCIDAGTNEAWMATAYDIDGEPRIGNGAVDMGCDEVYAGSLTGALAVALSANYTTVTVGYPIAFEADIQGRPEGYAWHWGDGEVSSNLFWTSHAYAGPGDYDVVLQAWNLDTTAAATLTVHVVSGATNYVSPSGSHSAPYLTWATAATNIQAAIAAQTIPGGTVLVTNGVYDTGGVVVHGSMANRIAITNEIVVRGVNGPEHTFIVGSGPLGDAAVRCAYVGDGARLEGFTLTNGHTRTGGDQNTEQAGGGAWCEPSAVVSNCTISGNAAWRYGGGTYFGTVQNCTISGNGADFGGGTYEGMVQHCAISGNEADYSGGGTSGGTVRNCTISGNSAGDGGGTYLGTVQNCTISGNSASYGGGMRHSTVQNCTITGNSADHSGGGTRDGTVQNCTISGNEAEQGGGTSGGTIQNCVVYYNSASVANANCSGGTVEYTCTTPDPGGVGNITNAPGLTGLDNPHLVWESPCIDAGTNESWMAAAFDIDGEPRIGNGTVDMGCDEVYAGSLTGALAVAISADYTNVAVGFPIAFEADIQGRPAAYAWDWGDGEVSSNLSRVSHAYAGPGDYEVVLEAWNLDTSASATLTVHVVTPTNYVSQSGSHTAPYLSWATAATNIQAAIASSVPGGVVLVTNGVYDTGGAVVHGTMTNRIAITNLVTVRSVNGPEQTFIVGSGPLGDTAVRCAYVGDGARLEGFTLTNGHTRTAGESTAELSGGGVWCEPSAVVSNCTISGNVAWSYGGGTYYGTIQNCTISGNMASHQGGGGTYYGTVQNCTISGNKASWGGGTFHGTVQNCSISGNSAISQGGGTYLGTVQNCTVAGNWSLGDGGGTYRGTVQNCVVYYNSAAGADDNCDGGTVEYTCTIPDPGGAGNITNDPQFVDAAVSNFHLLATSPCIDAGGNQVWMAGARDLDGNPRIHNGTVDMGCYEYDPVLFPDTDGDGIVDAWELQFFSSLTNLSYHLDWDLDGFRDGFEFHSGTIPTNAASYLGITSVTIDPAMTEAVIRWSSESNILYSLHGSSNLVYGLDLLLDEHIPATPPENAYTDTVDGVQWRSYGVEVEP